MKHIYLFSFILVSVLIHGQRKAQKQVNSNEQPQSYEPVVKKNCGTIAPDDEWEEEFQKQIINYKNKLTSNKISNVARTIPVVVHVIHNGNAVGSGDNIPNSQIVSQINILNADFAGTGLNASSVPSAFSGLKANTQITFCLATVDVNGNTMSEAGVDRINYSSKFSGTYPSIFQKTDIDNTIKPATIWDPSKYMNIWIFSNITFGGSGTLLGYATFPPSTGLSGINSSLVGNTTNDGVVIWRRAFGNVGDLNGSTADGRTATHEVGHYLGLRHIWGDASCGSDFCGDTPTHEIDNSGCPSFPHKANNSCGTGANGEMFMNFMDYSNDPCLYLFTPDQNTRMQTALSNSNLRSNLGISTPTLCSVPQQPIYCDTLTNFVPTASNIDSIRSGGQGGWGWVAGHNNYLDKAKAEEFNYAAGTKKMSGALIYLDHALAATSNSLLRVSYWPNNGSAPATSATAFVDYQLAPIPEDAYVYYEFNSPVTTSSKFFVGIDNLTYGSNQDSISLMMAKSANVVNNTAWEKLSNNTWQPFNEPAPNGWGIKSALTIFPVFICPSLVGVEEVLNPTSQTIFFPNPAHDKLLIALADNDKSIKARTIVRDSFGKTIMSTDFNIETNKTINLSTSELAEGIYFVELITDQRSVIHKIVVKH